MFVSVIPVLFPRWSVSRIHSDCVFFIASNSIFRSWTVLFLSPVCIFLYFFKGFIQFLHLFDLYFFNHNSLRDFFSCLKASIIFITSNLISFPCTSGVLGCPVIAEVGCLDSSGAVWPNVLLLVFLH